MKQKQAENVQTSLTVVTINFNNAEGLSRTIASVASQASRNSIEYIVVDGASTDSSKQIIAEQKENINRLIVEKDEGVYDAMNKGVNTSSGKFTLFLNSGDIFSSSYSAESVVNAINKNPNAIAIYGDTVMHNDALWSTKPVDEIWKGMICSHQSIAISTKFLKEKKFDMSLKIAADYKTILQAFLAGGLFVKVDTPIAKIEEVGISSDFRSRTLERWLINKQLQDNVNKRKMVNSFYANLLFRNGINNSEQLQDLHSSFSQDSIIFLVSMPRSGSTLLQRILESSDYIASTGEPWIALPVLSMYSEELIDSLISQHVLNEARNSFLEEIGLSVEIYNKAEKVYLETVYNEILSRIPSPFYLDKTPRYVHVIQELYSRMPNAKYIVLLRDPVAVINSYCTTWAKNDAKIAFGNKYFQNDFKAGFKKLIDFVELNSSRENLCVVDYDQMVANPLSVQDKIEDFLGLKIRFDNIIHSQVATNRQMGDPKTINTSNKVLQPVNNPLEVARAIESRDHYIKCLNIVDRVVWDYFSIDIGILQRALQDPSLSYANCKGINKLFDSSVSAIITCYNNAATIESAISSVASQSCAPDEIIVIDDDSTDHSVSLINKLIAARCDIPIKLLQNQKNLGVSASRDIAIRYSSGTYITTLDGDDQMSPFKIQAELKVIKENNAAIAFSDIKVVGKDGARYLNTRKYHKKTHKQLLHLLLSRSAPVPRDMLIKKSIYEKTGGFLHGFNLFEDWMLKQKLAQFDGIHGWVHSGVVGTYYDRTNPGLSNRTQLQLLFAQLKVLAINVKIVQKYPENLYDALKVLSLLDKKKQCVNFHDFISLMENDLSMSEFCFKILVSLRQSLSMAPANNSADDAIINYIDSLFGRLR